MNYRNRQAVSGVGFMLPAVMLLAAFNVFPILYAVVVSFFRFDFFSPLEFVGLKNYLAALGSPTFWDAIRVTATYTVLFGPASWLIGFVGAYLLKDRLVGRGALRSIFFIPTVLSSVAMATAWSLMLQINGPISALLGARIPWLTTEGLALVSIAGIGVWQAFGWFMVVFLAGLLSIPESYYEAAKIDGADSWQLLRYITVPHMRPIFALVVIQTVIAGLKVFTPMFVMTGGGPNDSTRSVAMLIYQSGLRDFRMGYAAAISVIGFLAILALTVLYLRIFRVHEEVG